MEGERAAGCTSRAVGAVAAAGAAASTSIAGEGGDTSGANSGAGVAAAGAAVVAAAAATVAIATAPAAAAQPAAAPAPAAPVAGVTAAPRAATSCTARILVYDEEGTLGERCAKLTDPGAPGGLCLDILAGATGVGEAPARAARTYLLQALYERITDPNAAMLWGQLSAPPPAGCEAQPYPMTDYALAVLAEVHKVKLVIYTGAQKDRNLLVKHSTVGAAGHRQVRLYCAEGEGPVGHAMAVEVEQGEGTPPGQAHAAAAMPRFMGVGELYAALLARGVGGSAEGAQACTLHHLTGHELLGHVLGHPGMERVRVEEAIAVTLVARGEAPGALQGLLDADSVTAAQLDQALQLLGRPDTMQLFVSKRAPARAAITVAEWCPGTRGPVQVVLANGRAFLGKQLPAVVGEPGTALPGQWVEQADAPGRVVAITSRDSCMVLWEGVEDRATVVPFALLRAASSLKRGRSTDEAGASQRLRSGSAASPVPVTVSTKSSPQSVEGAATAPRQEARAHTWQFYVASRGSIGSAGDRELVEKAVRLLLQAVGGVGTVIAAAHTPRGWLVLCSPGADYSQALEEACAAAAKVEISGLWEAWQAEGAEAVAGARARQLATAWMQKGMHWGQRTRKRAMRGAVQGGHAGEEALNGQPQARDTLEGSGSAAPGAGEEQEEREGAGAAGEVQTQTLPDSQPAAEAEAVGASVPLRGRRGSARGERQQQGRDP